MKERPKIFNAEEVRALLDGRKSQFRIPVKTKFPIKENWVLCTIREGDRKIEGKHFFTDPKNPGCADGDGRTEYFSSPFGLVGDKLWVRETFRLSNDFMSSPTLEKHLSKKPTVLYYANDNPKYRDQDMWKPSIHMPRWASRITLEVTGVSVERLMDISENDALLEGVQPGFLDGGNWEETDDPNCPAIPAFKKLWDSTYSKKGFGWDKSPWVWVVEFKQAKTNKKS